MSVWKISWVDSPLWRCDVVCNFNSCTYKGECYIDGLRYCKSHYRAWKRTGVLRPLARRNKIKDGLKECFMCERTLDLSRFNVSNKQLGHHYPACADCQPTYLKVKELGRRYGLSHSAYLEMIKDGCDVCGSNNRLSVDHDHNCCDGGFTCGACVRGVLCNSCNLALGMMRDSPNLMKKMIEYVGRYEDVAFFEDSPEYFPTI